MRKQRFPGVLAAVVVLLVSHSALAQGIIAPGAGPVLRSFGGTAIAAPLDSIGALYWNPGTLGFLDRRIDIGTEAILKSQSIRSTIPAGLLGPGLPPTSVTGKTDSDDGTQLGPAVAIVIRFHDERLRLRNLTLSAGAFPCSGGGSNYPADPNNPTLVGLGGWYNNFVILTFPVAASYKFGEHLSVGLAADFAQVTWQWSRAIFVAPEMAIVDGRTVTQFAPASASGPRYGFGLHAGAYYHSDFGLGLGLMIKSPIWFQSIHYNSTTISGGEREVSVKLNTPLFLGAGASWDGVAKWLFAVDLKYAFYEDITGFYGEEAFFRQDGRVNGLGYDNGLAVTFGVQFKPVEKLALRLGYKYSTQIVPDTPTFEVTSSSLRHALGGGISYDVADAIALHATYVQSWAIPVEGEMTSPLDNQPIPGSHLRLTLIEYAPSIGITFRY